MPDNIVKEYIPFISPDSLRAYTHLMKNFYNGYIPSYLGETDIHGSEYVGTIENFGSEILIESRKMKLKDPKFNDIIKENSFDPYFNISYSHVRESYDQQSLLIATLKPNVLFDKYDVRIKFENIEQCFYPRATYPSGEFIKGNKYIKTKSNPKLVFSNKDGEIINEYDLILNDTSGRDTEYYFQNNENYNDFIDEIDFENGIMFTVPISNKHKNIPFVWISIPTLQLLIKPILYNNKINGKDFFAIGQNKDGTMKMFPFVSGEFPINDSNLYWFIKAYPMTSFPSNSSNNEMNFREKLQSFSLFAFDSNGFNPGVKPVYRYDFAYDTDYGKITLDDNVGWSFYQPRKGDYEYNTNIMKNKRYAFTRVDFFNDNIFDTNENYMRACFNLVINKDMYLDEFEPINANFVSGIHLDDSSDYSDNGVDKKNGVIYSLGDLDGLPKYYKYMIDDDLNRAHIEIYSIKDNENKTNQKISDKHIAGVIIDSGVPKVKSVLLSDLKEIGITYDRNDIDSHKYITITDNIRNINNVVTDICYINDDTFSDNTKSGNKEKLRFIYHGNNFFSTTSMALNNDNEVGRVYVISNDSIDYENNELSMNPKPERTFARICDIPTSMSQLIGIPGVAPVIIIDEKYNRTECMLTINDKEALLNQTWNSHLLLPNNIIQDDNFTVDRYDPILEKFYKYMMTEDPMITLYDNRFTLEIGVEVSSGSCKWMLESSGLGYDSSKMYYIMIGMNKYHIRVETNDTSNITSATFLDDSSSNPRIISAYNLNVESFDDDKLYLSYKIYSEDDSVAEFASISIKAPNKLPHILTDSIRLLDDIYFFKYDSVLGNLWAYEVNDSGTYVAGQITGKEFIVNPYDESIRIDLQSAMLLNNKTDTFIQTLYKHQVFEDIYPIDKLNAQDGFYMYITYKNDRDEDVTKTIVFNNDYNIDKNAQYLPYMHQLNLKSYTNTTNKFKIDFNTKGQPNLYIWDPYQKTQYRYNDITGNEKVVKQLWNKSFYDLFNYSTFKQFYPDLFEKVIDTDKNMLKTDVFAYNDLSLKYHDEVKQWLYDKNEKELYEFIAIYCPHNKYPILSKDGLVTFIMTNIMNYYQFKKKYIDEEDTKLTIYSKPDIEEIAHKDDTFWDGTNPIGPNPSGEYYSLTSTIYDKLSTKNIKDVDSTPLYIFRLDNVDPEELNGCRMYDDYNNDITFYSLLFINNIPYCANMIKNEIRWISSK